MKLVIQIPCHNEEHTLPLVFERMPRTIPGISEIEFQIIDDGSTDNTEEVAKALGVHHVIKIPGRNRRWLGRAFRIGIDAALLRGADIIVNTDGDNQYPSERIQDLVLPILSGNAEMVIGDRKPSHFEEFSLEKRLLQRLGNIVASWLTGEHVRDAVSGFRAYSARAAVQIHSLTNYTYTIDTLIQAYKKGIDIAWIDISPNAKTRESRLIKSLGTKVAKSGTTILRISTIYQPFRLFFLVSLFFLIPGVFYISRFLWIFFFFRDTASGHVQSVILGGVSLTISIQMFALGIIAELLSTNRQLVENCLTRIKLLEMKERLPEKDD